MSDLWNIAFGEGRDKEQFSKQYLYLSNIIIFFVQFLIQTQYTNNFYLIYYL
jgi:hypothetical protein